MKSILLLVNIVTTRFKENNFEMHFANCENDIVKLDQAIEFLAQGNCCLLLAY